MTIRNLTILIIIMIGQVGQSQTKKAYLKAAAEKFSEQDYYSALTFYSEALAFDSTDLDVRYNLAESARKFNAYTNAALHYSYILDADSTGLYPESSLRLGQMWTVLGNYEDAISLYNIYLGENGGTDQRLDSLAKQGLASAEYAKNRIADTNNDITVERLPSGINTPFNEFAARSVDDSIYYSSHSIAHQNPQWGEVVLGRILQSDGKAEGRIIEVPNVADGKSIANATFSQDSVIVLSICEYINPQDLHCDLFMTSISSDGALTTPTPLNINADSATTTQPFMSISPDGEKVLFFVSDRAGGVGGLDLYYAESVGDNQWSDPINIRSVNTAGNEISPSFNPADGRLYWSSDGRLGIGGYDIYSSRRLQDGTFDKVMHLDVPINSSYNDIYYTVNAKGNSAYFSSNRKGSLYLEPGQEACCYDIFEADLGTIELDLLAMTFDLLSNDTITGVTVTLYDAVTGELLDQSTNLNGKDHTFELVQGRDYLLISSKPGYYTDTLELSTVGIEDDLEQLIYLDSDRHRLDVLTFAKKDLVPLPGTTVRLIDVSDPSIGDIVQVNEDSNDYFFILEPQKRYRIEASKNGFITAVEDIAIGQDMDKNIRLDMYLDVLNLNDHLPVSLYFDNDQPDPGSRSTATTKTYTDLYTKYIGQEDSYRRRNPSEASDLGRFFDEEVRGGYERMQKFYNQLYKSMTSGEAIELTLKGHASPLAVNKYNLVLSQRRVESVKNDIANYRGGILRPYLDNGQIIITDISYGEEIVKKSVSDQGSNKRSSIYSVDAALERRVEIIKATKQK